MFDKLKERWEVNGSRLLLILCTFAIGGSLCGFAGRQLLVFTGLEKGPAWIFLYILFMTILWPFCVLLVSIPFGQLSFFRKYLWKIWIRMTQKQENTIPIAIFASGAGSNAEKIIQQFNLSPGSGANESKSAARVSLIVCNKPGAGVLQIAARAGIDTLLIEKERFFHGDHYIEELRQRKIGFIVLAGFLWKVPPGLIRAFPDSIVNIHPALLPKYGGKGMYGKRVHEAVLAAGDKESGITIHFVDELYDHGKVILQASCKVDVNDTPESLAQKIHLLEHQHYPAAIEALLIAK